MRAGGHCWRGKGADGPYGLWPGQYAAVYDGGKSDEVATAVEAGGPGLVTSPDWLVVAGGVSRLPTLTLVGGLRPW